MEDTRKNVNEYLIIEEFNKLHFQYGEIPSVIIDFVDYLTGTNGLFIKVLT